MDCVFLFSWTLSWLPLFYDYKINFFFFPSQIKTTTSVEQSITYCKFYSTFLFDRHESPPMPVFMPCTRWKMKGVRL